MRELTRSHFAEGVLPDCHEKSLALFLPPLSTEIHWCIQLHGERGRERWEYCGKIHQIVLVGTRSKVEIRCVKSGKGHCGAPELPPRSPRALCWCQIPHCGSCLAGKRVQQLNCTRTVPCIPHTGLGERFVGVQRCLSFPGPLASGLRCQGTKKAWEGTDGGGVHGKNNVSSTKSSGDALFIWKYLSWEKIFRPQNSPRPLWSPILSRNRSSDCPFITVSTSEPQFQTPCGVLLRRTITDEPRCSTIWHKQHQTNLTPPKTGLQKSSNIRPWTNPPASPTGGSNNPPANLLRTFPGMQAQSPASASRSRAYAHCGAARGLQAAPGQYPSPQIPLDRVLCGIWNQSRCTLLDPQWVMPQPGVQVLLWVRTHTYHPAAGSASYHQAQLTHKYPPLHPGPQFHNLESKVCRKRESQQLFCVQSPRHILSKPPHMRWPSITAPLRCDAASKAHRQRQNEYQLHRHEWEKLPNKKRCTGNPPSALFSSLSLLPSLPPTISPFLPPRFFPYLPATLLAPALGSWFPLPCPSIPSWLPSPLHLHLPSFPPSMLASLPVGLTTVSCLSSCFVCE